jgi:hypothetical protein
MNRAGRAQFETKADYFRRDIEALTQEHEEERAAWQAQVAELRVCFCFVGFRSELFVSHLCV